MGLSDSNTSFSGDYPITYHTVEDAAVINYLVPVRRVIPNGAVVYLNIERETGVSGGYFILKINNAGAYTKTLYIDGVALPATDNLTYEVFAGRTSTAMWNSIEPVWSSFVQEASVRATSGSNWYDIWGSTSGYEKNMSEGLSQTVSPGNPLSITFSSRGIYRIVFTTYLEDTSIYRPRFQTRILMNGEPILGVGANQDLGYSVADASVPILFHATTLIDVPYPGTIIKPQWYVSGGYTVNVYNTLFEVQRISV